MPTIEEKRVYADRTGQSEVYVASDAGIVGVNVSDDLVGKFSLASRCDPRGVAAAGGEVAAATAEDVVALTGGAFESTGFGPAVAVDVDDESLIAADEDGTVSRRPVPGSDAGDADPAAATTAEWTDVGAVGGGVTAIDWPFVATDEGLYRVRDGDLRNAGLSDVNDVAATGVPLAATDAGLYKLGNGWMEALDGAFRAVASDGQRAHAASADALYAEGPDDGNWTEVDVPVSEPIADVAYTPTATVCVTDTGTLALTAGEEWRTRMLGVGGVVGVAVR